MRRLWLIVAIVVLLAAVAVAIVAPRLADDGGLSATAWADSVCASLDEWRTSIVGLTDVSGGLDKASLEEKLSEASRATAQLVADVRALGPPDLESGAELEAELEEAVGGLERQVETLETAARQALEEATTPADLFQALATLAPQFRALLASATDVVGTLRDSEAAADAREELGRAFDEATSCRKLRAGA
ncbi:MAG: hypothetical protein RMM28_00725 [Thermoleophilia bacterium]|nr:hypothetical protein [Gaiellaceae bacterium]MDW8337646.1 hypothetical protein [Thermoleophilia bacterium]